MADVTHSLILNVYESSRLLIENGPIIHALPSWMPSYLIQHTHTGGRYVTWSQTANHAAQLTGGQRPALPARPAVFATRKSGVMASVVTRRRNGRAP